MEETDKLTTSFGDYLKIVRDAVLFYTTAFFVLLLIFRYEKGKTPI